MAHEHAGNYAAKHPSKAPLHPRIARAIEHAATTGTISCTAAHAIASELEVSSAEVGETIDRLEIKISQCQLGLFGHHPQQRSVQPAEQVEDVVRQTLEHARDNHGISCHAVWQIAEQYGLSKIALCGICETLRIKIIACQLGAF